MQKKQKINLQQDYTNYQFLEPQDLQNDSTTPEQKLQLEQQYNQASSVNLSSTQHPQQPNSDQPSQSSTNPPPPPPKYSPSQNPSASNNSASKPMSHQRSSLEQQIDPQQHIKNQLILQFKISQLQKICTTLTSANEKLLDKIEELQDENEQFKDKIISLQKNYQNHHQYSESLNESRESPFRNESEGQSTDRRQDDGQEDDESQLLGDDEEEEKMLEQEVTDIEQMIKDYREELTKAESLNKTIKESLSQRINQLEEQLFQTQEQLSETQRANYEMEQQLMETQSRNQSLEKQIESLVHTTNLDSINGYEQYFEDQTARNRTESRSSQYMTPVHRANYHNSRGPKSPHYDEEYSQQTNQFDSSVQLELEKLIQKLVNQLEHERNVKKRMTEEMKRIQKDLLENQKEIMQKNKKIHQLEMNLLKGQKTHIFNTSIPLSNSQIHPFNDSKKEEKAKYSIFSPSRQQTHNRNYNSPGTKDVSPKIRDKYLQIQRQRINTSAVTYSPPNRQPPVNENQKNREYNNSRNPNISQSPSSAQTKHLQTFSLLQLLNEPTITLTVKEKLHITLKLVQFYEHKIYQYKNYNLLMLENVLVTNFNRIKLGLVKIRVEEHKRNEEGNQRMRKNSKDEVADGPEKVIWNLGFLLNSLLVDVPTKQDDLGASIPEQNLLSLIDNILDNRSLNKELFSQLRECLEAGIQQRTQ